VSIYRFIDLRRRPAIPSVHCVGYFGFQEAATMSAMTVRPPTETVRMPLSLSGSERFTSLAEKPMATPESMPNSELWECIVTASVWRGLCERMGLEAACEGLGGSTPPARIL
jgi:hypothetical protein